MDYYKGSIKEVFSDLKSNENGLKSAEAKARLEEYGYNRIESKKRISPFRIFLQQFNDPVIWVLIGALVISIIIGYYEFQQGHGSLVEHATEPLVIAAIVIANAIIGFLQEYQAEKAIEALKKMASLKAIVLREEEETEIDAELLVPGDIILLSPGEKIPADARLISLNNLQTQEAALTGESVPVKKEITGYKQNLQIGDQKNMVFSGTVITDGKAKAIVVKTGMKSEIGKIAKLIEEAEETLTPLQKKLEKLGKFLTYLVLVICLVIFGVLFMRGQTVLDALIIAVSLAVAAIPEGLPAVVTISLALGVQRMIKKNALIRKLPSVETLGSTTVICSDKTGTLTKNEMTVKKVYVDNQTIEVSGSGYEPEGTFSEHPKDLDLLLQVGMLNNDARLEKTPDGFKIIGDPTEGALIVSGEKAGFNHISLIQDNPRVDEILFDSIRKRMTTIHNVKGKKHSYVKGAPDVILNLCTKIVLDGKIKEITAKDKHHILKINEQFSNEALRVLGFAYKEVTPDHHEKNLIFIGLQGMIDPPRLEAKISIEKCKTAGIKVIMITGDYIGTAVAIAHDLGIEGKAISGQELEKLDLNKHVEDIGIYARVNPEHKMNIVDALKKKGHIVAMTGDGVNDAPALKAADIGIAMGITGTDVSKEASDMILTDDNFTSIVNAVEEGRGIYDNIQKFVQYLLSCNIGEVFVIFLATLLANTLGFLGSNSAPLIPLIAVQILWMNLVTDGLPAVALGVDPIAAGVMTRKPRDAKLGIMTKSFIVRIFYIGALIAIATLGVFWYYINVLKAPDILSQTMAFTTLVLLQFIGLYLVRSGFRVGLLSNKWLILAVFISIVLQMLVIHTTFGSVFNTVKISFADWSVIGLTMVIVLFTGIIINKILLRFTSET